MNSKQFGFCVAALLVLALGAPALAVAANLTFVPVAPCRVFDSRCIPPAQNVATCPDAVAPGAGAGNDFAASETRPINIVGTFDQKLQGGQAVSCGVPGYDLGSPVARAVAVNITAILPNNKGNIRVWDSSVVPPAVSNINFTTNVNIANSAIVALSQDATEGADISALTGGPVTSVHMVVDIVGYWEDDAIVP